MSTMRDFNTVLRELEAARVHDEELHERESTADERISSRERLEDLRAEMAQIRAAMQAKAG